jgi:CRP-like cAMP-binding protein
VITSLSEGEYVGDLSVIFDEPQPATVQATSEVTVIAISKEDILSLRGSRVFEVMLHYASLGYT